MKNVRTKTGKIVAGGMITLALTYITFLPGCKKNSETVIPTTYGPSMQVVYLTADDGSYNAAKTDTNLVNAWGIAISPNGKIWVSSEGKGVTTIYDGTGATVLAPVTVTGAAKGAKGMPTGQVYNSTTDFVLTSNNNPAKFVFCGLDGAITAWNTGAATVTVAMKDGASYTGLAIGNDGTGNFLYAADNKNGTIDVYDKNFTLTGGRFFSDPDLPAGFKPYNIQNIDGLLYVTYYAVGGGVYGSNTGNGFVNVFNPNGTLVNRFASRGPLNLPWGVAKAPAAMGLSANAILIGNFGDGHIIVYEADGTYDGQLQMNGTILAIDGLWAITTAPSTATSLDPDAVYFAAGPAGQKHGTFGYIKKM
ncbi:MAG TPA: TIGR03118 family protein [Bacteroidales bacterium]|nr:TIGR03118 family protein [Bacteroidales bacterium]